MEGLHIGIRKTVLRIMRLLVWLAVPVCLGYGILLLIFGTMQQNELDFAKEQYTAIQVQITEMQHTSPNDSAIIVVLRPDSAAKHLPAQLGQTIATTTNRNLAVGDKLTMYYDPQHPDTRTIDFQTAAPLRRTGILFSGGALLSIAVLLVIHRLRNTLRHKQTATIPNH